MAPALQRWWRAVSASPLVPPDSPPGYPYVPGSPLFWKPFVYGEQGTQGRLLNNVADVNGTLQSGVFFDGKQLNFYADTPRGGPAHIVARPKVEPFPVTRTLVVGEEWSSNRV